MQFSQDPVNTIENLIYKNKTKSISIYLVLVLAIIVFLFLLPVITVDISSQSRGSIRSNTDNVPLMSLVSGKVTYVNIKNNRLVQKGDTLVQLTLESIHTDQATNQSLASDLKSRISDLSKATAGNGNALNTPEIQ